MSVPQPPEGLPVRGENESSMKLSLHSAGDHNGNAFPVSSSSSSSSSSTCLGESSPESLRNESIFSGGRTYSPLDHDMFEVNLMTKTDKMTDSVISKWVPEEESKLDEVPVGKMHTGPELSESNDNSVSVYLDAHSREYQGSCNDNLTLALSLTTDGRADLSNGSRNGGRRGSSTPDSDATEIPADDSYDDDDDEEEDSLFLSVSSDCGVKRISMSPPSVISQMNPWGAELHTEGAGTGFVLHVEHQREPSEDLIETKQTLSVPPSSTKPGQGVKEVKSPPPDRCAVGRRPTRPHTSQPARPAKTKLSPAPRTPATTAIKPSATMEHRVSKLDQHVVKEAKVGSWSSLSPPDKQNKSAPTNRKRAIPQKEEAQTGDGGKKQRSSAGLVKVAMVLKSIQGKSSNLKTNRKTAAHPAPPERKRGGVSRTLSASSCSLGSEVAEEGAVETLRKVVQELPHESSRGVEAGAAETERTAVRTELRTPSRVSTICTLSLTPPVTADMFK
ncbi:hypothetical protein PBY51_020845 [Eleginops maclovinus]|uniref:Uncharacterized protein n=1 Tax=Eleginops maclovinus TaxID=56733 RepID=A0AAN7XQX8_ELEMC|nr:hypothetical protein PBY51_020845 [Eleginops maclovinus]